MPKWKVVWATNVYVRNGPTRDSPKVAELTPGTIVQELRREGDWLQHSKGWTLTKAGNNICMAPVTGAEAQQTQQQQTMDNSSAQAQPVPTGVVSSRFSLWLF